MTNTERKLLNKVHQALTTHGADAIEQAKALLEVVLEEGGDGGEAKPLKQNKAENASRG